MKGWIWALVVGAAGLVVLALMKSRSVVQPTVPYPGYVPGASPLAPSGGSGDLQNAAGWATLGIGILGAGKSLFGIGS